jgi:hypothetical protein
MDELVPTSEAARLLGVSQRTLHRIGKDAIRQHGQSGGAYATNLYSRSALLNIKADREGEMCAVCGKFPVKGARQRTCGSPGCVRTYRHHRSRLNYAERKKREASRPPITPPQRGTGIMKILREWSAREHMDTRDRYVRTAAAAGVSIATVVSVIRYAHKGQ